MIDSLILICVFILGTFTNRYLIPIFDLLLDVFSYKQSEKVTMYQLNTQELVAEFHRRYPEMNDNQYQELTPTIGFTYRNQNEDDIYFEDEECGKK